MAQRRQRVSAVSVILSHLASGIASVRNGGGMDVWVAVTREFCGRLRRLQMSYFRELQPSPLWPVW